jgi:hypothetical protein
MTAFLTIVIVPSGTTMGVVAVTAGIIYTVMWLLAGIIMLAAGTAGRIYPPAIAPTIRYGSAPLATASGSAACGASWDRSCWHAKNLTNARRFPLR